MSLESHRYHTLIGNYSSQGAWTDEVRSLALAASNPQDASNVDSGPVNTCPDGAFPAPLSPSAQRANRHIDGLKDPPNEADEDEEFGEFVAASANPFEQHAPCAIENEDESQPLLNPASKSSVQDDVFVGFGLILPTFARLDLRTRHVRRAGSTAKRAWQNLHGQQFDQRQRRESTPTTSAFARPAIVEDPMEGIQGTVRYTAASVPHEAERSVYATGPLLGPMRPVSFARPSRQDVQNALVREMEDELEAKRAAWTDENA